MSDEETSSRATRTTTQVLAQQQQDAERDRQVQAQPEAVDDNFGAPATDDRVIQGVLLRCVDGNWHDRDKLAVPSKLLALTTFTIAQRWRDQKPEETIDGRVSSLPDVGELNAKIPETQWEKGINGKRPPWQRSEVIYLLDETEAQKFTFASGTVGATIAVEELRDRVKWMRVLRGGAKVVPIVELANKPMKTQHGVSKLRPHFKIAGWCNIVPASEARPAIEHVKPPTTAEELDDEIPF
jgi:hypothetical protein